MKLRTNRLTSVAPLALFAVAGCHPPAAECPEPPKMAEVSHATPAPTKSADAAKPTLVVTIAIDQFRADYLTRLAPTFGETGFKRLLREGASYVGHYGHYATYTGPGHALILSGSYPYVNGISTNKWYSYAAGRSEAMVFDANAQVHGVAKTDADMDVSPANFYGSTLGDELWMGTGGASKTIAIATKGRGAILLGGRHAKTYWMNDDTGLATTSTYYEKELSPWVSAFNGKKLADASFGATWDRLLPASAYVSGVGDDAPFEGGSKGLGKTFPHKLDGKLTAPGPDYYEAFMMSPFANDWELELAKAAVEAEKLGQRGTTDLLAVSISATDLAGHDFGPFSHEVQDIIARTDRQLGGFLDWLYAKVGKDKVLVVLTADHGATPVPEQLAAAGFAAGRIKKKTIKDAIEAALVAKFGGEKWVVAAEDPHVFLDRKLIESKKLDPAEVQRVAGEAAAAIPGFGGYFTRTQLLRGEVPDTELGRSILRTYFGPRGGDLVLWTLPFHFWGKYGEKDQGSTHGTFYTYDTDVPVILAGPGILPGKYGVREMVDLAPTLAHALGISAPAGSEGALVPVFAE
jgi:predicted AlkP superfamily pyrophosphatase or phosphodiesterase